MNPVYMLVRGGGAGGFAVELTCVRLQPPAAFQPNLSSLSNFLPLTGFHCRKLSSWRVTATARAFPIYSECPQSLFGLDSVQVPSLWVNVQLQQAVGIEALYALWPFKRCDLFFVPLFCRSRIITWLALHSVSLRLGHSSLPAWIPVLASMLATCVQCKRSTVGVYSSVFFRVCMYICLE